MDTDNIRDFFSDVNHTQKYPKGTIIVLKGGSVDQAYYIKEGLIKIYDIDSYGDIRTFALFGKQAIFPTVWLLEAPPEEGAAYYYECLADTTCYVANRDELREYMVNHPRVAIKALDTLTKIYINTTGRVQNLQRSNVQERVEFALYYNAVFLGEVDEQGVAHINCPLTHQTIAELIGLSRETVTHALNKPRFKEIYKKTQKETLVDLTKIDPAKMPVVYKFEG
jgi:CRP-like cAMP-binding protein